MSGIEKIKPGLSIIVVILLMISSCSKEGDSPDMPEPYLDSYSDEECLANFPLKGSQPQPNKSCVSYSYDGESTLEIVHYNSGFNCCPGKIMTGLEMRNDTIIVTEVDSLQLCRCNCLYNVEHTIRNVPAGRYVLLIEEALVPEGEDKFVIDLDLSRVMTGEVCIDREYYPWQEI